MSIKGCLVFTLSLPGGGAARVLVSPSVMPLAGCLRPWFRWLWNCMRTEIFAQCKIVLPEHCWWLTSQTCVNTLINETNVKVEATTLNQFWCCY